MPSFTLTFVVYVSAMLVVGWLAYQKTVSRKDYILGNRDLGASAAALSAGASDMSGWLLLGLPGLAFVAPADAIWLAAGLAIGAYLNWLLLARRLRIASADYGDALTIPEFLAHRFPAGRDILKPTAASLILFFTLSIPARASSQRENCSPKYSTCRMQRRCGVVHS